MDDEIYRLRFLFNKIKNMGWIKSVNKGNSGVGLTFEKLLGIGNNELEIPDYNGIEIKTKRINSVSYITLFSCKPEGKYYHEVERIKDTYGYPHRVLKEYKVLNNSVYGDRKNKIGIKYYFKLDVKKEESRIFLEIFNMQGKLIEKEVYWDFAELEEKLNRKLKYLALIRANSKKNIINGVEYFKYCDLKIYCLKSFGEFIELIDRGVIRINFKLNIITKGDKIGQIHDHGTSFDIMETDIDKLYERVL